MIPPSTRAFYRNAATSIADLRARATSLQSQIGSGNRLHRSSDDPLAAAQLRTLARAEELRSIHQENAERTGTDLRLADTALSSLADYVIRARELATQAASATMSAPQRQLIAQELTDMRQGLFNLANTRDSAGFALFGGEGDAQAYAMAANGTISYVGTAQSGEVALGDGQSVTRAITGPEFLNFTANGAPTSLFTVIEGLASALAGGAADPAGAASAALGTLDSGLQSITTAQTIIGARMNWLDFTTTRFEQQAELASEQEARIGGADIAATITQLQETMTVLEASQASFAKLASLSLFDRIG